MNPIESSPLSKSASVFAAAVVIGRWQILHLGHATLFDAAFASAQQVIIVIGSAFKARDPRNPFTWQERQAMIDATLTPEMRARVHYLPIRDYFDDERWGRAVQAGVSQMAREFKINGAIGLVSFKKDVSGYYQDNFPQWTKINVTQKHNIDATSLRNVFFDGSDLEARLAVLKPYVYPEVLNYLQAWSRLPVYAERAKEHAAVIQYRKDWPADQYLTADAVICASGYVLMGRRKSQFGYGLWAFPGGFLNRGERFFDAALREAEEETTFRTLLLTMMAALRGSELLDHPDRSARTRLISMAYYFDLGNIRLPEVKGCDDFLEAKWIWIPDLLSMEDQIFEDHCVVADHFFGVFAKIEA